MVERVKHQSSGHIEGPTGPSSTEGQPGHSSEDVDGHEFGSGFQADFPLPPTTNRTGLWRMLFPTQMALGEEANVQHTELHELAEQINRPRGATQEKLKQYKAGIEVLLNHNDVLALEPKHKFTEDLVEEKKRVEEELEKRFPKAKPEQDEQPERQESDGPTTSGDKTPRSPEVPEQVPLEAPPSQRPYSSPNASKFDEGALGDVSLLFTINLTMPEAPKNIVQFFFGKSDLTKAIVQSIFGKSDLTKAYEEASSSFKDYNLLAADNPVEQKIAALTDWILDLTKLKGSAHSEKDPQTDFIQSIEQKIRDATELRSRLYQDAIRDFDTSQYSNKTLAELKAKHLEVENSIKAEQDPVKNIRFQLEFAALSRLITAKLEDLENFAPNVLLPNHIKPLVSSNLDFLDKAATIKDPEKHLEEYIAYLSIAYMQFRFSNAELANQISLEIERAQASQQEQKIKLAFEPNDDFKKQKLLVLNEYIKKLKQNNLDTVLHQEQYEILLRELADSTKKTEEIAGEKASEFLKTSWSRKQQLESEVERLESKPSMALVEKKIELLQHKRKYWEISRRTDGDFIAVPIRSPEQKTRSGSLAVSQSLEFSQHIRTFSYLSYREYYVESLIKAKQELGQSYPKIVAAIDRELLRAQKLLLRTYYQGGNVAKGRNDLVMAIQEDRADGFHLVEPGDFTPIRETNDTSESTVQSETRSNNELRAIQLQDAQESLLKPFLDWQPDTRDLQTWSEWFSATPLALNLAKADFHRKLLIDNYPDIQLATLESLASNPDSVTTQLQAIIEYKDILSEYKAALQALVAPNVLLATDTRRERIDKEKAAVTVQLQNIEQYLKTESDSTDVRAYYHNKLGSNSLFSTSTQDSLKKKSLIDVYSTFAKQTFANEKLEAFLEAVFTHQNCLEDLQKQKEILSQLAKIATPLSDAIKVKLIDHIRRIDSIESGKAKENLNETLKKIDVLNNALREPVEANPQKVPDLNYQAQLIQLQNIVYKEKQRQIAVARELEELGQNDSFDDQLRGALIKALSGSEFNIDFATLSFQRQLALHGVSSVSELAKQEIPSSIESIKTLLGKLANPASISANDISQTILELKTLLEVITITYPELAIELSGDVEHVNAILQGRGMAVIAWKRGTTQNIVRDALGASQHHVIQEQDKILPRSALLGIALLKSLPELFRVTSAAAQRADSTTAGSLTQQGVYWLIAAAGLSVVPFVGFAAELAGRAINAGMAFIQTKAERNLAKLMGEYRDTEVAINAIMKAAESTDKNPINLFKTAAKYIAKREAIQLVGNVFRDTVDNGPLGYPKRKWSEFKKWLGIAKGSEILVRVGAGTIVAAGVGAGLYLAGSVLTGGILPVATAVVGGLVAGVIMATRVTRRWYRKTSDKIDSELYKDSLTLAANQVEKNLKDFNPNQGALKVDVQIAPKADDVAKDVAEDVKAILSNPKNREAYSKANEPGRWLQRQLLQLNRGKELEWRATLADGASIKAQDLPGCQPRTKEQWTELTNETLKEAYRQLEPSVI